MLSLANRPSRVAGRHFLQIPGPTPVPDRILQAIAKPTIDHRGPEFQKLGERVLEGVKSIFNTKQSVVIYPASGTGAWEAALVNTLSSGDRVLMCETGHFAGLWREMALRLGLDVEFLASDWRTGVDADVIEQRLCDDTHHEIKAVCVVHNETSTGTLSPIDRVRAAVDAAGHPALLMVDTISSLASTEYRHDEWGVDVTVAGSQKGLMMPPGLSFNAISQKALRRFSQSNLPKHYWSWDEMLQANGRGFFPYTPSTNLLHGLAEAIDMLHEEGLDHVFARHRRHGQAVRAAARAWDLEILCRVPERCSPVLTAIVMPEGRDADAFRATALENFDISLGQGLGKLSGKVFRIGHLGDTNDLTILGALAGVEMTLQLTDTPHKSGGVQAAMQTLSGSLR